MKKIGILTYHRSINYGAVMQAYSLSKRIKDDFQDCEVEIIDYMSKKTYLLYNKSVKNYLSLVFMTESVSEKKALIGLLFAHIKNKLTGKNTSELNKIFENQLDYLPLSKNRIVSDDLDEIAEKISQKYDVIIVGSDAVFNWQIRQFPNPYFLHDNWARHKMSYAASSYGQDYTLINDNQKKYIKEAWDTFDYIGVRDNPTEKFVKYVGCEKKPVHNCDPTVFLELDQLPVDDQMIKRRFIQKGIDLEKPIIGLMCKSWLAQIVKDCLGERYQIVSVFVDHKIDGITHIDNLMPFEWARIFSFFDVTFTHFFHGNLLSLRNLTPTIPIEKHNYYNKKHISKIRDLMTRLELIDNCFYEDEIDKTILVDKVESMIMNKEKIKKHIDDALDKEANSYNSFRETLKSIIVDEVNDEKGSNYNM